MLRFVLRSAAPLLVLASAPAQDFLGIMNRTDTSFTSRGSATVPNSNPSVAFDRIDKETYAGWGFDPLNPGMRQIIGLHAWLQDQIGTTPETFQFVVYPEDPASLNFPNVAAPIGTTGPIPTPPTTATGAIAWEFTANFATPLLVPATSDTFVGVILPTPATGTWPADGMSCWALYYVSVTSGISDLPGASHPTLQPENGNGGWYVPSLPSGPTYTVTPRQWKIEPIVPGAAGVAGTITNQTTAPSSNVAPGTSSQGSGLYPDAQNPPLNAGRVDDIAGRWFKSNTPDNTPVFFLMSLGAFGPEIPVNSILPGSTGVTCIDLATNTVLGISFTTAGEAFLTISIPAGARSIVAGLVLVHQAAAINATGGIDANGCTRQIL